MTPFQAATANVLIAAGMLLGTLYVIISFYGIEHFHTQLLRKFRNRRLRRKEDEDDDPRGIGGGYA